MLVDTCTCEKEDHYRKSGNFRRQNIFVGPLPATKIKNTKINSPLVALRGSASKEAPHGSSTWQFHMLRRCSQLSGSVGKGKHNTDLQLSAHAYNDTNGTLHRDSKG